MRLRPIRCTDKPALARFHRRLSAETRYRRYHSAKGDLTTSDLRYLTEVDGRDHVALVAERPGDTGEFLGVARVVVDGASDPRESEVAVVVADDAHGAGLGRELAHDVLERARLNGAERVVAHVQADNHRALRLFQGLGFRQRAQRGPVLELVTALD